MGMSKAARPIMKCLRHAKSNSIFKTTIILSKMMKMMMWKQMWKQKWKVKTWTKARRAKKTLKCKKMKWVRKMTSSSSSCTAQLTETKKCRKHQETSSIEMMFRHNRCTWNR